MPQRAASSPGGWFSYRRHVNLLPLDLQRLRLEMVEPRRTRGQRDHSRGGKKDCGMGTGCEDGHTPGSGWPIILEFMGGSPAKRARGGRNRRA